MKASDVVMLVERFEVFYQRELSDVARQVWIEVFSDVEFDAAMRALNEIAADEGYPPTPVRIRQRAMELDARTEFPGFGEVFAELVENATTCDYFDPNPPVTLSPVAYELARMLGWADFRATTLTTYYEHQAERRYDEIVARARRRVADGLPAFAMHAAEIGELPAGMGELIEGIGGTDE